MLTSKRGTCTTKTVMGCLNASVVISYQCYFGKHESHTLNLTKQWTMQLSKNVALEEARHLSGAEPPHCFQERSCHLKRKIVGSWRAKLQPFWRTLFQHELKEKICWVSTFPQRLGFGRRSTRRRWSLERFSIAIWRATRLTSFSVSSSEGARTGSFPTCFVILFRLLSGSFTGFVQGNVFGGNHRLNTRIRGVPIIISEVLQATLYGTAFQHEINHVALFVGHWPILARVSFAPKDPFFLGLESFKMFHGLRLQPILAVNVCKCAIWRWFPFTSPCLSMGECEAMPAASSVTPFFLVTCAYRQRSLLGDGSWLTSQIQIDSSNDPLPFWDVWAWQFWQWIVQWYSRTKL